MQPHGRHDSTCMELSNSRRALKVSTLRELIHSHNPSMVFLMETKQNSHNMNLLRKSTGFHRGINADPIGVAGGLSLWWKPDISVEVLSTSKNLHDVSVNCILEGWAAGCFFFYGPPYDEEKPCFWNSVMRMGFKGPSFTWVKREDGDIVLQERLDRGLVSGSWVEKWPDTNVTHCTRVRSLPSYFGYSLTFRKNLKNFQI